MRCFIFPILAYLLALLSSCEPSDKESFKPGYSGNFGEIVVVAPKHLWEGIVGDSIRSVLKAEVYGLPQNEPQFFVINATPNTFKTALSTHRNVLWIELDEKQTGGSFELKKSKWARGQLLLELSAGSQAEMLKLIRLKKGDIIRVFNDVEINRLIDKFQKQDNTEARKQIEKHTGIRMWVHKDAQVMKADENTCWIRMERIQAKDGAEHQISQGILIFKEPYIKLQQFLDDSLLAYKNRITQEYIKGPGENSYMTTEMNFVPPMFKEINFRNRFGKESRGLWKMENNFMGGPFYSLSYLMSDEAHILHVYAYAYCPAFDKREYVRELEAMIKSIED